MYLITVQELHFTKYITYSLVMRGWLLVGYLHLIGNYLFGNNISYGVLTWVRQCHFLSIGSSLTR